jgi:hypothetical protein
MAAPVEPEKLTAFLGRFLNDLGAAAHGPAGLLGEQPELYTALAKPARPPPGIWRRASGTCGSVSPGGPRPDLWNTTPARIATS